MGTNLNGLPSDMTDSVNEINWFGVSHGCDCHPSQCVQFTEVQRLNARVASSTFFEDDRSSNAFDNSITHMVTQVDQFLDHDLSLTPEDEVCDCWVAPGKDPNCFSIRVSTNDHFYSLHNVT